MSDKVVGLAMEKDYGDDLDCVEILEAHNKELEKMVDSQQEIIEKMEFKIYKLEKEIDDLEETIDELEGLEEVDEEEVDKFEFYETLVDQYYHDDFSMQEIFKRIGKKAVEVEFQKFLMTCDN